MLHFFPVDVLEVENDEADETFGRRRVFFEYDGLGDPDFNRTFKDDVKVLALVAIVEDDRGRCVFLQAQLLAKIVVCLLVVLLARLDKVRVAEEALLGLLDLLRGALLGVLEQYRPQGGKLRDFLGQFY